MTHILNQESRIERFFEEISQIPRNSGCEKEISDYIVDFGKKRGFETLQDDFYNVIVKKPASQDSKEKKPLILEAHMDMVCAKKGDSHHDFTKDSISLQLDEGVLQAKDTTLGADDGFGVAYMLAILDDHALSHPPLECVFTVREEIDMGGAKHLDKSLLQSRRMISLDGDVENEIFVGCACSDQVQLTKTYEMHASKGRCLTIALDNFYTGTYHGVTHPECGNAIKIGARLLYQLGEAGIAFQIASWEGGSAENKNPFESKMVIYIDSEVETQVKKVLTTTFSQILQEFSDERFTGDIHFESDQSAPKAVSFADSAEFVRTIHLLPNNLFQATVKEHKMQAINNIGLLEFSEGKVTLTMAMRGMCSSSERELVSCCRDIGILGGFEVTVTSRYSPWDYKADSKLRALAKKLMKREYGIELQEAICPGGLEIASFMEIGEDFDALELGINLQGLHTPEECMNMESFHRMYQLLCTLLAEIE